MMNIAYLMPDLPHAQSDVHQAGDRRAGGSGLDSPPVRRAPVRRRIDRSGRPSPSRNGRASSWTLGPWGSGGGLIATAGPTPGGSMDAVSASAISWADVPSEGDLAPDLPGRGLPAPTIGSKRAGPAISMFTSVRTPPASHCCAAGSAVPLQHHDPWAGGIRRTPAAGAEREDPSRRFRRGDQPVHA